MKATAVVALRRPQPVGPDANKHGQGGLKKVKSAKWKKK